MPFRAAGVGVTANVPAGLPPIRGDRMALELVLDNLIDNAIRYSASQPRLVISAHRDKETVVIDVIDHGIGINEDELGHVTRKFFRGRGAPSGGGGLGLAIVHRVVSDHGGSLAIRSTPGKGTTVSVTLPASPIKSDVCSSEYS
jgi:signal transduction histidine kinase